MTISPGPAVNKNKHNFELLVLQTLLIKFIIPYRLGLKIKIVLLMIIFRKFIRMLIEKNSKYNVNNLKFLFDFKCNSSII